MSLLDEARSVLTAFREHVATWTNSGMLVTIDGHLDRLAAVVEGDVQAAEEAVKGVLGELYSALHGGAPAEAPPEAPAPSETPAVGGVPTEVPMIVGESGPELALPDVAADPTPESAPESAPVVEEPQAPEATA